MRFMKWIQTNALTARRLDPVFTLRGKARDERQNSARASSDERLEVDKDE
jgi:hypothetical protein